MPSSQNKPLIFKSYYKLHAISLPLHNHGTYIRLNCEGTVVARCCFVKLRYLFDHKGLLQS